MIGDSWVSFAQAWVWYQRLQVPSHTHRLAAYERLHDTMRKAVIQHASDEADLLLRSLQGLP